MVQLQNCRTFSSACFAATLKNECRSTSSSTTPSYNVIRRLNNNKQQVRIYKSTPFMIQVVNKLFNSQLTCHPRSHHHKSPTMRPAWLQHPKTTTTISTLIRKLVSFDYSCNELRQSSTGLKQKSMRLDDDSEFSFMSRIAFCDVGFSLSELMSFSCSPYK